MADKAIIIKLIMETYLLPGNVGGPCSEDETAETFTGGISAELTQLKYELAHEGLDKSLFSEKTPFSLLEENLIRDQRCHEVPE
ncbi:hypothetical protein ACFX1R_035607 [Malus domestica]